MSTETQPFDCPGNYQAPLPTNLRCSKCNRPLAVKDAKRTPTGYVCPYFVKARVATFYNASPLQHVLVGALAIPIGIVVGLGLSVLGRIGFFSIILTMTAAPAAGAGIAELIRRIFKGTRGQYFWLAASIGVVIGSAWFTVLPLLLGLLAGNFGSIWALIPLVGLGILVSAMVARMRL